MEIKKVGVVGCGQMGGGIALVSAQSGYQVVVSEINDELLSRGLKIIDSVLTKSVDKGKLSQQDKDAALARIKGITDMKGFHDCDLVIESATENMELKKKIFAELDKICSKDALLASNTSCLSILDMAMMTSRPEKVAGLHFFNPVHLMPLIEVIETIATSKETINACTSFSKSLKKETVLAKDTPGFIPTRIVTVIMLEAIRMLEADVGTKEDIDAGIRLGLNHPMGPLTLCDLIGLDTTFFIANAMYEEFKAPQYAPPVLLRKMVTAGRLGRKVGKGFYDYT